MSPTNRLYYFHQHYIANTAHKAAVTDNAFYVTQFTPNQMHVLGAHSEIILISTRALKHMYDKRTAREYDLIIKQLHTIMQTPDMIVTNPEHHGSFGFVKKIENKNYFASLEITQNYNYVVTCFLIKQKYLGNKKIIQDWRGG